MYKYKITINYCYFKLFNQNDEKQEDIMRVEVEGNASKEIMKECKEKFEELLNMGYDKLAAVAVISSKYCNNVTMAIHNDVITLTVH